MISYMKGTLAFKGSEGVELEVGGVGYEIALSSKALASLPSVGSNVQIWTYLQVKEDGFALFGFSDMREKDMFTKLVGISGVGAKMALCALSTFRPEELSMAIAQGDVARISTVPGIGKKTAQRIVLELQGVLKTDSALGSEAALFARDATDLADASDALVAMGFSEREVAAALEGCTATEASDIMRYALKRMGGA